jgi:hypothetical protein
MFALSKVIQGKIVKRPSAQCKTPYVADVSIEGEEKNGSHPPHWVAAVFVIKMQLFSWR